MDSKLLVLNRDEVIILTDRTLNTDTGTDDQRVVSYRLLVKLGILYLELVDPAENEIRESTIAVTEAEAWLLRAKINSGDKMQSDPKLGMRLLRKLYRLLVDFDADVGIAGGDHEGQKMGAWEREALGVWKKREDGDDAFQPA